MEVSPQNLSALFTGFDVVFQRGFEKPPSYYESICSIVRSSSRVSTYPWLGRTTKFREWLGDRVIQALEAHSYTIANRNFEDTVSIDRNDIEDDTYGVYEPIIEQLGWDTKVHPDMLLFQMIKQLGHDSFECRRLRWAALLFGDSSGRSAGTCGCGLDCRRTSIAPARARTGSSSMLRVRFVPLSFSYAASTR